MGFIIDNKGVRPDPSRVQALAQWPAPSNAHDLKSFMGDMNQPFEMETDASQFAIGVFLKQGGHPVAYHSEALVDAKLMYNTYDKEFYSLVQALKQWRHYILGKETILHTDHHPLIFINSQRKIQEKRHLKWASYIQQFHLVIKYKKGTSNKMADLLSRPPCSGSTHSRGALCCI